MKLKWWIIVDVLVFYAPLPFFILSNELKSALGSALLGTGLILWKVSLYVKGVREVPLNPLKFFGENTKATITAIAIIVGVMSLCKILNVPPHYP